MSRNTASVARTGSQQAAQPKQEDFSQYVKKGISQDTIKQLKECFDIFDADGSG